MMEVQVVQVVQVHQEVQVEGTHQEQETHLLLVHLKEITEEILITNQVYINLVVVAEVLEL
tara:strand:+ start:202 stop:384 length:183 start_codon:yes stop_codon:yes gene_type:complete